MAVLRMVAAEWATYHRKLGQRCYEAGRRGARSAALRVVALMVVRTREAMPASEGGFEGAVNTGAFARAWRTLGIPNGARVTNTRPYAAVIEYGRRPNSRPPPIEPIARWLRRRAKLKPADARAAAWVVARAIGRRGLRGRQILTHPSVTAHIEAILEQEIRRELDLAIAKPP